MPRIDSNRSKPAVAAALAILLAGLLLAACGGSSKSSSSGGSTAKTTAASSRGPRGSRAALRSCLHKNGVTLPERKAGQGGAPGAGGALGAGGAGELPKGVTPAQLRAALKKCGGARFGRAGAGAGGQKRRQQLVKFAACMRHNGMKVPPPDISGKGPIFNTQGLDTKSAAFRSALSKCSRELAPTPPRGAG